MRAHRPITLMGTGRALYPSYVVGESFLEIALADNSLVKDTMNEQPIYFVSRETHVWKQWADSQDPPLPQEVKPPLPVNLGAVGWTLQTYLHLRRRGANVHLSSSICPGAINVVFCEDIPWKRLPFRGFIVAIQADRARPQIADMRIVQNQACIRTEDAIAERWLKLLNGPVYQQYRRWKQRGGPFGILLRAAEYPGRLLSHYKECEKFNKNNPDFKPYKSIPLLSKI